MPRGQLATINFYGKVSLNPQSHWSARGSELAAFSQRGTKDSVSTTVLNSLSASVLHFTSKPTLSPILKLKENITLQTKGADFFTGLYNRTIIIVGIAFRSDFLFYSPKMFS